MHRDIYDITIENNNHKQSAGKKCKPFDRFNNSAFKNFTSSYAEAHM